MFGAGPGRLLVGRTVRWLDEQWEFMFGTDDALNFESIMQLCLIVDQESLFLSPRLIWITVNGHVYRCARINFTNPMLKRSFNRPFKLVSMQVYSIQTLTFRHKVISLQLDSILIKVVSRNHRSRFDTCRKSIRFNSSSGP